MLSTTLRRTCLGAARPRITPSTLGPSVRWATSDYGSGKGDPKGEKPQDQGANPSADKEHPGAPPPKEGQGSGGSPTKGTSDGHNTGSAKQGGQKRQFSTLARQFRQYSTERDMVAKDRPKSTKGLKPKILDEKAPSDDEVDDDVKSHNRDMEGRSDRAHEQIEGEEKVDSKFWSEKKDGEKK
ncbi:Actin-like protein [Venturia nashicola]|uniref:Actin-like protein n=1 Tax=Venturia nashicola TaxID=86259 RepID=A0A4Z1PCU9_9PEZI|nr:Actin-like protein [Venturia nashicola]TLD37411.1 Actin-like protein [Venturia nashicola]